MFFCVDPLDSKVSRPDKLAVHVFEVDEDVDKDEVSLISVCRNDDHDFNANNSVVLENNVCC